jgi:hypothetical protein
MYGWGLGVTSGSRLAWTLPTGFSRFSTTGVDAAAGAVGTLISSCWSTA